MPALGPLFARALLPRIDGGPARVPASTAMVARHPARPAAARRLRPGLRLHPARPRAAHLAARADLPAAHPPAGRAGVDDPPRRSGARRPTACGCTGPVGGTEVLDAAVRIENLRPHRRGAQLDVVSEIRVGEELVWDGVSTYLAPGAKVDGVVDDVRPCPVRAGAPDRHLAAAGRSGPRLPARLGRPEPDPHQPLAARAFGFARPIVHGMWTHARLLAALEPRLPDAYDVEATFARPILLPAKVGAWWHQDGGRLDGSRHHPRRRQALPAGHRPPLTPPTADPAAPPDRPRPTRRSPLVHVAPSRRATCTNGRNVGGVAESGRGGPLSGWWRSPR